MPRPPSFLARSLEPLAGSLLPLFLVWTAVVAAVWVAGIGEVELAELVQNPGLLAALQWLLRALDPLWLTLGAVNIYLSLAASDRLAVARRWMGMSLLLAATLAWLSSATSWPLGPIFYTARLGAKVGPVPFALPLLAVVLIIGARETVLRAWPRGSHALTAFATGLLVAAAQWVIEPTAAQSRAWWLWYPAEPGAPAAPPVRNFIAWGLAAWALARLMREERVAFSTARRPLQPVVVFLATLAAFLAAYLAHRLRS